MSMTYEEHRADQAKLIRYNAADHLHLMPWYAKYRTSRTPDDYLSIYIHYPYCKGTCAYCMYSTLEHTPDTVAPFLQQIEEQYRVASTALEDEPVRTFYFGGGSPTLFSADELLQILELTNRYWNLDTDHGNMFTIEGHVNQWTPSKLTAVAGTYINRVSMGVQSLRKDVLKKNLRPWIEPQVVFDRIQLASDLYKSRVNVDMMHGISGQTSLMFVEDVLRLVEIGTPRISLYAFRNQMCFGDVQGNQPDNANVYYRPVEDSEEYQNRYYKDLIEIQKYLPDTYQFFSTPAAPGEPIFDFECNVIVHKERMPMFRRSYEVNTEDYNNVISFGSGYHLTELYPAGVRAEFDHFNNRLQMIPIFEMHEFANRVRRINHRRSQLQGVDLPYVPEQTRSVENELRRASYDGECSILFK